MSESTAKPPSIKHYFVDEAGDGVLFSRRGKRTLVGTEGCSRYFILGLVDIVDTEILGRELEDLRTRLLADSYFKDVPSMQPEQQKTALFFHAKDDVPEVRREVFALLRQHKLRFFAVVRDKMKVVEYVRQRNEQDSSYHYTPNELYDYMVRRLFTTLLHKEDRYDITFAKRGKTNRTLALQQAIEVTRRRFSDRWNITSNAKIMITPTDPPLSPGLQVADYFLWALQRLYERREDRYVTYLWESFRLVHDLDDTRDARYGFFYTQKKPLTRATLPNV